MKSFNDLAAELERWTENPAKATGPWDSGCSLDRMAGCPRMDVRALSIRLRAHYPGPADQVDREFEEFLAAYQAWWDKMCSGTEPVDLWLIEEFDHGDGQVERRYYTDYDQLEEATFKKAYGLIVLFRWIHEELWPQGQTHRIHHPTNAFYPPQYFLSSFNITGDQLRKAKQMGYIATIQPKPGVPRFHYSEADAKRLWPGHFAKALNRKA